LSCRRVDLSHFRVKRHIHANHLRGLRLLKRQLSIRRSNFSILPKYFEFLNGTANKVRKFAYSISLLGNMLFIILISFLRKGCSSTVLIWGVSHR
jgi:hypothetical protein